MMSGLLALLLSKNASRVSPERSPGNDMKSHSLPFTSHTGKTLLDVLVPSPPLSQRRFDVLVPSPPLSQRRFDDLGRIVVSVVGRT